MAKTRQASTVIRFSKGLNTELGDIAIDPVDEAGQVPLKVLLNMQLQKDGSLKKRGTVNFLRENFNGYSITGRYADVVPNQYSEVPNKMASWITRNTSGTTNQVVVVLSGRTITGHVLTSLDDFDGDWRASTAFDASWGTGDLVSSGAYHSPTRAFVDGQRMLCINRFAKFAKLIKYDGSAYSTSSLDFYVRPDTTQDTDDRVTNGGVAYACYVAHTSSAATEPGVGANWRDYWYEKGIPDGGESAWTTSTAYTTAIQKLDASGTKAGPGVGTFAFGRFWASGRTDSPNTIYVSRVVPGADYDQALTQFFSFNDPRSTDNPTPTASDGGTVVVRGADVIHGLVEFRDGVVVLASNGVWFISSPDGGFNATNFSVQKIDDLGVAGEDCFTRVDDSVVYASANKVSAVGLSNEGSLITVPISGNIATKLNGISLHDKQTSGMIYNESERRLYWFINFEHSSTQETRNPFKHWAHTRDVLIFDTDLKAWFPYEMQRDLTGEIPGISDAVNLEGEFTSKKTVVDSAGLVVLDGTSEVVSRSGAGTDTKINTTLITSRQADAGASGVDGEVYYNVAFMECEGTQDFGNAGLDVDRTDYTWDIQPHAVALFDYINKKQIMYLVLLAQRVETGVIDPTTGNDVNAGGALLSVAWDWFDFDSANKKVGSAVAAYRPYKWNSGLYGGGDPGKAVVKDKHRVRGRGTALQMRLQNDGTKDYHLLGWQVMITRRR